jgi:phosphatidylserine decarboxylase
VAHDVKARDQFWVKGQPYSVLDMLAQDPLAEQFIGGTIYQAFLSALSYHRWHAPVSGTVKKAFVIPGTYYSEPLYDDFTETESADPLGESTSQGYITAAATRGCIFIDADNPKIGLVAMLFVGMAEVSTSEITVKVGEKVKKGDQLGMFVSCFLFWAVESANFWIALWWVDALPDVQEGRGCYWLPRESGGGPHG